MENLTKRDLLIITLPLLLIAGCTKATVENFQDENGIMYVEYNGNPNTQRPYTGEIIEHYDEKDGGLIKSKGSYKDGKLDGDEISSLILELFHVVRNEVTPSSGDEPVKVDSGKDEIQKLDRLYNEGYLSKDRYERLKQDLSR